mmetsp:Transcript_27768/g.51746  ORF Transcript_27768/g.51746 Transcript_27768/m.51746 type:complete len:213 (-) Transcript_27768:83-721(-)
MAVTQNLNLDMPGLGHEFLNEDPVIAKAVGRLVLGGLKALAGLFVGPGNAHALAATAGGSLQHHWVADFIGDFDRLIRVFDQPHIAGHRADARVLGDLFRGDLVAHLLNRAHRWADKGNALRIQRFGELAVLAQEPIAGMNRLRARSLDRLHHLVDDDIGLVGRRRADMDGLVRHLHMQRLGISIRINGNGRDTHFSGSLDNPAGDFTPVGD